jgi:orotidine-5'-phosphate decarboxylase
MKTIDKIFARMKDNNTLLCCGLDPDLKRMPREIMEKDISDGGKVLSFLRTVVDATAEQVCAYKAQKAFFDLLPNGHDVLRELISYVHTTYYDIPVIVDCKVGDIDNTMLAYAHNLFSVMDADGIVVNPYMGDDVILSLAEFTDKAIVVLAKTSNQSGNIVQNAILYNGWPLWRYVLDLIVNRWNQRKNMIPVLSSTIDFNLFKVRPLIPNDMPILLAGVGAQGGSYIGLRQLLNFEGAGVLVNSSRNIIYSGSGEEWAVAIKKAAMDLKNILNREREGG